MGRKLWVQCDSYYRSTAQMVSRVIVSRWLMHWYFSYSPPPQVWHNAVFRWVRSQGRNRDTSDSPQNVLDTVSIPLKKGASGARRQTQPLWRGLKPAGTASWSQRYVQWWGTPDQNRAVHNTAGRSVNQQLERCTNVDRDSPVWRFRYRVFKEEGESIM